MEGWGQGWSAQDIHYTIFLLDAMTFNVRNVMEKVSPVSVILPIFNCLSPALAFRHQGQSGTAGHGLVQGMKICNSVRFIFFAKLQTGNFKATLKVVGNEKEGGSERCQTFTICL